MRRDGAGEPDSGSIWWRRENDFDSLFPAGESAMRLQRVLLREEKFLDRMDYKREDDDHPFPLRRQMANLIGQTSVPRIGNLVENRAKHNQ